MSDVIVIDPAKGYVALPASLFDLDVSPGAFRALSVLCNLSDVRGYSWASLEQLAGWVKRSKSSISAYLNELRALDLIATEEQTRSNGANYRLKICVKFWAGWVASRSQGKPPAPQNSERRVQPAERPIKKKHKPIITLDTRPQAGGDAKKLFDGWQAAQRGQPYGSFTAPPAEFLEATENYLACNRPGERLDRAQIIDRLRRIWCGRSVTCDAASIAQQVAALRNVTTVTMDALDRVIAAKWLPHWRKPPTPSQFETLIGEARQSDQSDTIYRIIAKDYACFLKFSGKSIA
jgi:hypothetical protein